VYIKKKKKNPDCRAGDHARYLVPRQFPEEEYINGIFVAVYIKKKKKKKNPDCRAGDHARNSWKRNI
jgi:hypothetical protein